MAFIIAEEKALHEKVSDLKVYDPRTPQGAYVKAWFRFPEGERINEYPYITVTGPIAMTEARDRVHSITYPEATLWPSETDDVYASQLVVGDPHAVDKVMTHMRFIPYYLTYQVSTYARNYLHDRQMTLQLMRVRKLPYRYGWLYVPEDDTLRQLDLLSWQPADQLEQASDGLKTIHRKIWTVQITAHVAPFDLQRLYRVQEVLVDIEHRDPPNRNVAAS